MSHSYRRQRQGGKAEQPPGRKPIPAACLKHPYGVLVDSGYDFDEVMAVDDAIQHLEKNDPRAAEIVRLRFFAGLSVEETANVLGVSPRTVIGDWTYAKAWLFKALGAE